MTKQMGQKRPGQHYNGPTGYCFMIVLMTSLVIFVGNDFRHNLVAGSSILSPEQNPSNNLAQPLSSSSSSLKPESPAATGDQTAPLLASSSQQILPEQQQQNKNAESPIDNPQQLQQASQTSTRQARAESTESSAASDGANKPGPAASDAKKPAAESSDSITGKKDTPAAGAAAAAATTAPSSATKSKPSQPARSSSKQAGNKISSTSPNGKPRLQANIGSTMLQGSVSQMSKHDAYSAIAEKHGALAQDAMRRSDKRRIGNGGGFGPAGIQKASGLGDIFNPVKGMSDTGLARTLGASMRSMMKSKYSVPAYVASALLGAVALMAFYESPISPLPVPALPEAPAGRFPPEMPNLPVGTQVPFRYNPNQNYNQRSFSQNNQMPMQQGAQQQLFFPQQQQAQQRSQSSSNGAPSAVSQIATNLLNVAKSSQVAQRKSGPDFESGPSGAAKSLFNPINMALKSGPLSLVSKVSSSSNVAAPKSGSTTTGSGFLSYFGLGGNSQSNQDGPINGMGAMMLNSPLQQIGQQQQQMLPASGVAESKSGSPTGAGSPSAVSSLYGRFKSYFTGASAKPVSSFSSTGSQPANSPSESQFNRINFIQNLMKDASSSLPRFLQSPTNRKASPTSASGQPQSSALPTSLNNGVPTGGLTNSLNFLNSAGNGNQMIPASSRAELSSSAQLAGSTTKSQKKDSSGFMKVAHALLDSFTSGIAQRNAIPEPNQSAVRSNQEQDSLINGNHQSQQQQQSASNPLQVASLMVSDILANYPSPSSSAAAAGQPSVGVAPVELSSSDVMSSQEPQIGNGASYNQPKPLSAGAISSNEPIARSSDLGSSDIVIANDDYNQQHTQQQQQHQQESHSSYQHQTQQRQQQQNVAQSQQQQPRQSYSSVASIQSQDQKLQQHQAAAVQQQNQQQNSVAPVPSPSSDSQALAPNSSQHVRKTRSIGSDLSGLPGSMNSEQTSSIVARNQPKSRAAQLNELVDYVAESYAQNKLIINFVMNQVGLSHAVPYVEHVLTSGSSESNSRQWN